MSLTPLRTLLSSYTRESSSSSSSSPLTPPSSILPILTIASQAFESSSSSPLPTDKLSSSAKRNESSTETLKNVSSLIDEIATLKFLLAKNRAGKILNHYNCPRNIPLKKGQINIVPTIPIKNLNLQRVEQSRYIVVSMSEPVVLITSVKTSLAVAAVGFNDKKLPIYRGILHFDGGNGILESFISRMTQLGVVSIHLDLANGIYNRDSLEFINAKIKNCAKPIITIRNLLLHPYKLSMSKMEGLEFPVDLINTQLTMGICPDGSVFAIKNCAWKIVSIEKLHRLDSFCQGEEPKQCEEPKFSSLVKLCQQSPQIKQEIIQDLIEILRNNQNMPIGPRKDTFLKDIKCFIKELQLPDLREHLKIMSFKKD